jgi:hypothetical protein
MFFEFYLITFSISLSLVFYSVFLPSNQANETNIIPEFNYDNDFDPEYTNQNYYRNRVFDSDNSSLY